MKLDQQTIQIMSLVTKRTGATIKDCIITDNSILFIVIAGDAAKAIGKGGANVQLLERQLKKKVRIAEFSEDLEQFIRNLVHPAKLKSVSNDDGVITLEPEDFRTRGVLIGRNAQNLRQTESLAKRYFPEVQELKVA